MNRRGFITSALKVTAAGLLVPEHLWGRSMVAGFHSFRCAKQIEDIEGISIDRELTKLTLSFAEEFFQKAHGHFFILEEEHEEPT